MTSHDFFDRQRRIPGWDQTLISQQVCLCLGAGGLGTSVILGLSRLGVRKIHIVDCDVVEPHNLNRQVLFSQANIGASKAESSGQNACSSHALDVEVVAHNFDVRERWPDVVKIAKECTVIFNMIDIGDQFDVVVQALALTLKVPLLSGGTFRTSLNIDTFGPLGSPCLWCANPNVGNEFIEKCKPGPTSLELQDLSFIKPDDHPTGASAVFVSVTAGQLMVTNWLNLVMYEKEQKAIADGGPKPDEYSARAAPYTRIFMYLDNMDIEKFMVEPEVKCLLCPGKIVTETPTPAVEAPSS